MLLAKSTDAEPMETEVGLCSWLVEKTAEQDPVARWSSQAKKCQCSSWEWWERGAETGPWQNRTLLKSDLLVIKKILTPASPPHINLQVANFQRCECTLVPSTSGMQLALSCCWQSFSSTISHLLSILQSVTLLSCSIDTSPYMPVVILYYYTFARYYKIKNVFFCVCVFFNVSFVWKVL